MVNDKARRSVIQFKDVSFEYPGAETDSIHHISLDVKEGEFLVLTGGSGCGKTTLTRLVNGLGEQFYEGTLKGRITLLGRNISEYPLYEIGKKVGSIFQDPKSQFFASITEDEISFGCENYGVPYLIQAFAAGDISLATGSAHYAWMAVVFAAASILIYFIALNCTHLAAFRTATNMRKSAIHHIVTLPLGYFSQNASGRLRNIIDDNAGLTEGFLAHQLPDLTGAAVMPVAVIILIFLFDWRLGICCLIPMGISVIFLKQMMGGDNAQFMGKYMTALETMNKEAVEYIRGIPVVKVFQQTIYSFKNFHAAIEEYEKFASGYALKCRIPLTGFTVTLNGTFVFLIPVAMFILSGVSGQAAYENVVLDFLFYSLFTPVCATMMNRIMFASEQLMAAKSAVSRVDEILQEKPLKEPEHPLIPADASIVFSDVSFAYPGAKEKALDHISFEVPTGKTVALVGASGSGKSTAASLIPRFYDVQSGSVTIGGVNVRNIEKQELMKRVAFVFQNTCLFKDTLMNNIKAARPDATREEVLRAADEAQCKDIIDRLPDGLDTLVGTGGTYLSGGENQRIALARAILKDAPIIVLDEATAFADAENEHQIQLAFERLTQNKTVMMIAHRLSTIQDADLILVFKEGQIAERGTHEELVALNGIYSSMWKDYQTSIAWKVGKEDEQHD